MSHVQDDMTEREYQKLPMPLVNAVTAAHTAVSEIERALAALTAAEYTDDSGSEDYFRETAKRALAQAWEHAVLVDSEVRAHGEQLGVLEKKEGTS